MGKGDKVNVEYVSANPTGPLHVAHARGAVVGDALANLLAKAGYAVTKEYYINDAGAQVDKLGQSTYLRYREALGDAIGDDPRRPLSRRVPEGRRRRASPSATARAGSTSRESDWLPAMRDFAIDDADGRDQGRSRHARRPHGRLHVRARAGRLRRRRPRLPGAEPPGPDLSRAGSSRPRARSPTTGRTASRRCSAPRSSATTSTGRSRSRTAAGPTSPTTSPITTTSSAAASPT